MDGTTVNRSGIVSQTSMSTYKSTENELKVSDPTINSGRGGTVNDETNGQSLETISFEGYSSQSGLFIQKSNASSDLVVNACWEKIDLPISTAKEAPLGLRNFLSSQNVNVYKSTITTLDPFQIVAKGKVKNLPPCLNKAELNTALSLDVLGITKNREKKACQDSLGSNESFDMYGQQQLTLLNSTLGLNDLFTRDNAEQNVSASDFLYKPISSTSLNENLSNDMLGGNSIKNAIAHSVGEKIEYDYREINNESVPTIVSSNDTPMESCLGMSNLSRSVDEDIQENSPLVSTMATHSLRDKSDSSIFEHSISLSDISTNISISTSLVESAVSREPIKSKNVSDSVLLRLGEEYKIPTQDQHSNIAEELSQDHMYSNDPHLSYNDTEYVMKDFDRTPFVTLIADSFKTDKGFRIIKVFQNQIEQPVHDIPGTKKVPIANENYLDIKNVTGRNSAANDGSNGVLNAATAGHYFAYGNESSLEIGDQTNPYSGEFVSNILQQSFSGKEMSSYAEHLSPVDMTGIPEDIRLFTEETIMSQFVVYDFNGPQEEPDMSFDTKEFKRIPNLCESSKNNFSMLTENSTFNDKCSIMNESVCLSASFVESSPSNSLCALDNSHPQVDCTDDRPFGNYAMEKLPITLLDSNNSQNYNPPVVNESLKLPNPKGDVLMSEYHKACGLREKPINFVNTTLEVKKLPSQGWKSLPEKVVSAEEVKSLRENLFLVTDLLKKENNEFESFRKNCEYEKQQFKDKIRLLEDKVSALNQTIDPPNTIAGRKFTVTENIEKQEVELSNLLDRCIASERKLLQTQKEIQFFSDLCLLRENEVPQLKELVSRLNKFGFETDGIIVKGMGNIIQAKVALNIFSSVLTKYGTLRANYNDLMKQYEEDKIKLKLFPEFICNYNKNSEEVCALKVTIQDLQAELESNKSLVADMLEKLSSFKEVKESFEKHRLEADIMAKNYINIQEELIHSQENYNGILLKYKTLEVECCMAKESYIYISSEKDNLVKDFEKCKANLSHLKGVENKLADLKKQNEALTEKCTKFETSLNKKIAECEEFSRERDSLQSEVTNLKSLLDEQKRSKEEYRQRLIADYNKLKSQFEEYELLLDKNIEELEVLNEEDVLITKDCASKNQDSALLSEVSDSEFRVLMKLFDEINYKYKVLHNAQSSLYNNYKDALSRKQLLETNYALELECKNKCLEDISSLKEVIGDLSRKYCDVNNKCHVISAQKNVGECQLTDLKALLQELKFKYEENVIQLGNLEETCIGKQERNDELNKEVSNLKMNMQEIEERYSILKSDYDSLLLKFENKCTDIKDVQNEHSLLEHKYKDVLVSVEHLNQLVTEKNELCEKAQAKISSLQEEVKQFNENLIQGKLCQQCECSNVKSLQNNLTELHNKYEDAIALIKKLQQENSKQKKNLPLEKKLPSVILEGNEPKDSFLKLKADFEMFLLEFETQVKEYNALDQRYDNLHNSFNGLLLLKEKLEYDLFESQKHNELNALKLEDLNCEIFQLKETLSMLRDVNSKILQDYETESLKLNSLQADFSTLEEKYQELLSEKEILELYWKVFKI